MKHRLLLVLAFGVAISCYADTFSSTNLCWAAPATTSTDPVLNPAAFVDCTSAGSANVVTAGISGNQIFVGSAFAEASPTVFRTSIDVSITNYMRNMYQWSSTTGSPKAPASAATAGVSDMLTVTSAGGPGVYSLNYIFSLDGTLTSTDPSLFISQFCTQLVLLQGVGTTTSTCIAAGQAVPSTFTLTYTNLPFGGLLRPTLFVIAGATVQPIFPNQVGTIDDTIINGEMHVNFGSTLTLTDLLVTDSNGNPIPNVSISSQNAYIYPLDPRNQVPEPTGFILLGTVLAASLIRRWWTLRSGSLR